MIAKGKEIVFSGKSECYPSQKNSLAIARVMISNTIDLIECLYNNEAKADAFVAGMKFQFASFADFVPAVPEEASEDLQD